MSTQAEQLFLLEFLVDNIKLNDETAGTEEEPIRVRVKFIEFPWFEISQHQELEEDGSFNAGKSHLFPMSPIMLIKNLQRYPLAVTVFHANKDNPVPELIGQTRVKMTEGMTEAVQSAMQCNCNNSLPITYTLKDTYSLRNIGGEVGTITLFIRLTCFGQSIVTQFQLGGEKKAFLFQHSQAEDSKVCNPREEMAKASKEKEDPTKYDILSSSPFLTDEDTLFEGDCPCEYGDMEDPTISWKLPPPPPPPATGCECPPQGQPPPPQYPCPPIQKCTELQSPSPAEPAQNPHCSCQPQQKIPSQPAPSFQDKARCGCGAHVSEPVAPEPEPVRYQNNARCGCGAHLSEPVAPEPEPARYQDNAESSCNCGFEDGDVSSLVHSTSCTCNLPMTIPAVPLEASCMCGFETPVKPVPLATSGACCCKDGGDKSSGDVAPINASLHRCSCGGGAAGDWGDGTADGMFPYADEPVKPNQSLELNSKSIEGRGDTGDAQGRKPSILMKDSDRNSSGKRVSVVEAREKKVKKKRHNWTNKYGVQYPGIKCGHMDCVIANCQVPPHMGWLWNAKCPNRVRTVKQRKGWRPGAVGFTIAQIINRHRKEAGLNEINKPQRSKFKRGGRKVGKDGKVEGDQPPTLHVHRKDGAYYISMHPLNLGGESEQIPLEFTIPKRKGSDNDSESTESELEFDFMAPGAFEPKKPPVKFRSFGTQYADKDCSVDNLQLKGGKDKKGGKGKGSKKGKKADSVASGPEGRAKGGMSWDADPPTALEKGKSAKKKK